MRPDDHLDARGVIGRRIWNIALILVNLPSVLLDPPGLFFIFGLVVLGQEKYFVSTIYRHNGSAVSDVGNVADVAHDQDDNGTSATSLYEVFLWPTLLVGPLQKQLLCFGYSILNRDLRILREVLVSHDQLVELISEEVSAG